jgi:DNA-binding XRE family transcriptional regulator
MNLQIIKSTHGINEYVLLPMKIYAALHHEIKEKMGENEPNDDYVPFDPADYVDNPIALARIKANLTQKELAKQMGVSQAYISKIERQDKVSPKLLHKIKAVLNQVKN